MVKSTPPEPKRSSKRKRPTPTGIKHPVSEEQQRLKNEKYERLKKEFKKKTRRLLHPTNYEKNLDMGLEGDKILEKKCDQTNKDPPRKDS